MAVAYASAYSAAGKQRRPAPRRGQLSQEEVGRCVHHNQARKMSEDVFSGGDWETGLAKDDDVKRKAPSPQVHQTPDFSEKLS
ncbi:unnamed protein product [Sphagnum jensenii]|uniref:Uncharacterized protein n=1 Tax=Sphagnum jensenii TaxID=128206 RepID=A0ABP0VJZ6_9BRYO